MVQFYFILVLSYLIGAIPFGVVVSHLVMKKDVRSHGSGNIGATNIARFMGKKWGVLVLLLDGLKGYVVVSLAIHYFALTLEQINLIAGVAVLGHCYPIYLKFRGGKGVATALGVGLALAPSLIFIGFLVFASTVALSRIISLGSLLATASIMPASYFLKTPMSFYLSVFLWILIWWKHKENIRRLLNRQEPRFF